MPFELYERVKVKKNGVVGEIIDITETENGSIYTVESDSSKKRADADYPSMFPLYDCKEDEIAKL